LYQGASTNAVALYLDLDNDADYSNGDVLLGEVVASFTSDSNATLTSGASLATLYTGVQTTASGAKGTVIFKVMKDSTVPTTAVSATEITVDVK
jgi:hypothetical protein